MLRIECHYFKEVQNRLYSYEEHKQLIEALKFQDESTAVQVLKNNWLNSLKAIQELERK